MTSRPLVLHATQALLLIAAMVGIAGEAFAQQPTQAQTNAIRQSCRNDYMAHCASVPTGGAPALHCLQQHASSLSAACQQAVGAIKAPAPAAAKAKVPPAKAAPAQTVAVPAETAAPVAAPPAAKAPTAKSKKAQLAAIGRACGADYRIHCHGIPPGGGAAIGCLKRNAMTLSAPCQHALSGVAAAVAAKKAAPAKAPAAAAPVVAEPAVATAPVVVEPAPLLVSPREEMLILRTSCRRDYIQFCRGLRFGQGRVVSCLHYNAANLSPACQAAIYALREGR